MIISKKPGVDVGKIASLAATTYGPSILSGVGGFSGLAHASALGYKDLVLAAGADGVGTKVKIAQELGKHDTVGIDLVAMNADDVVVSGAAPWFFLDYIAVGRVGPNVVEDIVRGIAEGCKLAGCALLGGETAVMSAMYDDGEYDLAGFCVGAVEREDIVDGSRIRAGDVVLGLQSSGIHSNGYTTVRRVLLAERGMDLGQHMQELGRTLGEELLEPTRIYAPSILGVMKKVDLKGMAHITEGGIRGNVARALPSGLRLEVTGNWPVPRIFDIVKRLGSLGDDEMDRAFNMGIGMVCIVGKDDVDAAICAFREFQVPALVVGEVVPS